jgi:hypothetical protein
MYGTFRVEMTVGCWKPTHSRNKRTPICTIASCYVPKLIVPRVAIGFASPRVGDATCAVVATFETVIILKTGI